ncbi:hypothetical protein [Cellulomonas sp.]|uniref:hypothetical protein n=1 Tax=Cellulomonas sp. TaxID=40001 RepID=UPI001B103180|nr:hypothetical protein [Cellulomonas sp.]MBO9554578.1 hypothetical protein [Cellulomonas sp.]
MTTAPEQTYAPNIPEGVRRTVYYVTLVLGAVTLAASGLAQIYWPDAAAAVLATGGVVTSTMAFLCGGLGVAYVGSR